MPVNVYSCLHKNSGQIGSNSISFGEGNGNPLQYSCPENPVDRGACWAAVHRVAQSRTQLKWLSMHACIGEGNGTPLRCFFLENPRNRGAWWAAIYGVAQSRTRLTRLSMHACIGEGNGTPLQCFFLEEPGGLPSMGSLRVGHDWSDLAAAAAAAAFPFSPDSLDLSFFF